MWQELGSAEKSAGAKVGRKLNGVKIFHCWPKSSGDRDKVWSSAYLEPLSWSERWSGNTGNRDGEINKGQMKNKTRREKINRQRRRGRDDKRGEKMNN